MMNIPVMYRKRLIPDECICLNNDKLLYRDASIIVTQWSAIHPKPRLERGYSCYFLKEGYKVSMFIGANDVFRYWYCDIIDTQYEEATDTYIFTDLLADVIVYPDNRVEVIDIDEIATALKENLISKANIETLLCNLDKLLKIIYSGRFTELTDEITNRILSYKGEQYEQREPNL